MAAPLSLPRGRRLRGPSTLSIATGGAPRHRPVIPGAELGITSDDFFELTRRSARARSRVVGQQLHRRRAHRHFSPLSGPTPPWWLARATTALKQFLTTCSERATLTMLARGGRGTSVMPRLTWRRWGARGADGRGSSSPRPRRAGRSGGRSIACSGAIGTCVAAGGGDLALGKGRRGARYPGLHRHRHLSGEQAARHGILCHRGMCRGRGAQLTPVAIAAGRRLSDRLFWAGTANRHPGLREHSDGDFRASADRHRRASRKKAAPRALRWPPTSRCFRSSFVPLYHALTTAKTRL